MTSPIIKKHCRETTEKHIPIKIYSAGADVNLDSIVGSSDDAIISSDLQGNITSWNASAERMFGYTYGEARGKHISLIISSDLLPEEEMIQNKLRANECIKHFETARRNKSGSLVPISLTMLPIHSSDGAMIGATKIARDISERINAEVALKEASRKKDEFLTNMNHELRTPMNAVLGMANLLLYSKTLAEKDKKLVETLKFGADTLMDLINDLMDFAKLESDSLEFTNHGFSLVTLVESVVSAATGKAKEKNLSLHISYGDAVKRDYLGDQLRINQILTNLISNAIKFTDKGFISVAVDGVADEAPNSTTITFTITDTGIGISKEHLATIFNKFDQADASITRAYGGTGLGLALSKALVEKMGGCIAVESELTLGTTFKVALSLKNTERLSIVLSSAKTAAPLFVNHRSVLLVEDYEPNIIVATLTLESLGYDYEVAINGVEALRKFQHGKYGVILMDIQMPEMDGFEATRRIRQMESQKNLPPVPIIGLSAYVRESDKNRCFEVGMNDFILKPFDLHELSRKMAYYMSSDCEAG